MRPNLGICPVRFAAARGRARRGPAGVLVLGAHWTCRCPDRVLSPGDCPRHLIRLGYALTVGPILRRLGSQFGDRPPPLEVTGGKPRGFHRRSTVGCRSCLRPATSKLSSLTMPSRKVSSSVAADTTSSSAAPGRVTL